MKGTRVDEQGQRKLQEEIIAYAKVLWWDGGTAHGWRGSEGLFC